MFLEVQWETPTVEHSTNCFHPLAVECQEKRDQLRMPIVPVLLALRRLAMMVRARLNDPCLDIFLRLCRQVVWGAAVSKFFSPPFKIYKV